MLVYFLKAQVKIAEQPGMMLYGNPPRWHKFNPAVHTDASQSHYHAKKATEIAAAKEAAKGWTKEHDGQSPEQHIAAMKDKAKAIQAKASASAVITSWKQTLLAGKTPTPSQAKAAAELAATNPTKAAAVLKEIIDAIGADKAEALMHAAHAKAHQQVAQEAQAAVATKDAALQEAIAHLEQDSGQGDLPEAEKQEDAALVDKLKAAKDAPASAAAPKPAAKPKGVVKTKAKVAQSVFDNAAVVQAIGTTEDVEGKEAKTKAFLEAMGKAGKPEVVADDLSGPDVMHRAVSPSGDKSADYYANEMLHGDLFVGPGFGASGLYATTGNDSHAHASFWAGVHHGGGQQSVVVAIQPKSGAVLMPRAKLQKQLDDQFASVSMAAKEAVVQAATKGNDVLSAALAQYQKVQDVHAFFASDLTRYAAASGVDVITEFGETQGDSGEAVIVNRGAMRMSSKFSKPAAAPEPAPTVAPTTPVDTVQTDAAAPQPKHTFTNAKEGMEAYVTPGVGPSQGKWRVTLKDLDSGETLPTVYVVDSEAAAIAKAKKIVNLPSTPSTSAPAAAPTVAPPPAQPATPTATAQDVLQAELDAMKLPATNTNAKVVNAKIAKLAALVQAGDHAALASEKFGSNNYQKKLAKFAAKASGALAVAHAAPEDDDWEAALFGAEPQAADVPKTATVNGQVLTNSSGTWESTGHQAYWPGSSQYAAAELLATGTIHPDALKIMSLKKKAQAVSMAVDQGIDPKKALNKLMTVADPDEGPFEGDTHTLDGVTYVLQNGRWHRQAPPEATAEVTPAMQDAAVAAAFASKETWAYLKHGWAAAVSNGQVPTLEQAGIYEVMAGHDQQLLLNKLVERHMNKLSAAQFMAVSQQADDADALHVNGFLADQFLALHAKALQQGATAPASAPAITTTINGVEFTKANGVWSATNGGPEFGPGTMPYLAAELYAGLRPDPAVLKQHDPSVLSMVVGELAKDGQDPVKLLNAVFPKGGADGAYGNGAVFTVGLQDFVLHNGKWQEQTQATAPGLAANLPGPSTPTWEGGNADAPDVAGWYAAMLAGKTPNKAQQAALLAYAKASPADAMTMNANLKNVIGNVSVGNQLKPHYPQQYSPADKEDILQDWVHAIAYGKQPTIKMALIYDSLNDQSKQNWAEQALMEMGFDPDDDDAMQAAKDKLQRLQNAALGLPAVQPSDTEVKPPVTVQFDGMTYTKTSASTWSSAFGDVAAEDGPNFVTLTVLAGQKPDPAHLAMLSDQQKDIALFSLNYSGLATDAALNAVYPPASAGQTWPQESDTKTYKGVTYILHNGRWHLMNQAAPSGGSVVYMADHVKKLSKLGYTAALINGKVPTKAQHQAYLQALTAASDANLDMQLLINTHNDLINTAIGKDAHDDLKLQMHQAISGTAPAAPTPTVVLTKPLTAEPDDTESWAFDASSQKGSNLGGLYTDKSGQKWYVKVPKSEAHARNELLAAKLYEAAGVAVPKLKLVKSNGQVAIASQWVDGMQKVGAGIKSASGALEGFAVDAWLANYDSVGTGYDNLLKDAQGKAVRIDVGGALLFRAQGAPKTDFGNQVTELQSMLDPAKNSYTAAVFGGISADQIKAGAAKVAAITPDQIKQMVQQYGPGTATEKAALADKLIARREDLLKKHPVAAAKPAAAATTATAGADTSWHQSIKDGLDFATPAKNNVKYKATLAKIEKFKKLLDAQDYTAIANTAWGKISYGHQIQKLADKVAQQVGATAAPQAATPSAPPFDPSKLGTPPDFMSWGSSGSPGPSSVLAVNEANQEATQAIYAAAQTGDVAAVTAVEGKLVDKATGQVTGTAPVLQHPSQHISSFAQQMVNEIEEQKIVKAAFAWGTGQSALAAIDKMSDVVKDFATKAVKKVGYFIELSRPGVVGKVSDLITAAKVTWKSGKLTEQTYAKKAQAAYVKIPKAQLQALASYTGSGYHEINKSLWQGNPMGAAKAAEKALHTYGHAVQEGTILSRKLDLSGKDLQDFLKSEGSALQEPAVMSTSINPSVWSGNVQLKLNVGPGVKGLYVGYGSVPGGGAISVNAGEQELLLPPNTRIYVVSIKKTQKDPNASYGNLKDVDGFGGNSDYVAECVVLPTKPL
jgi:hypothetical protein